MFLYATSYESPDDALSLRSSVKNLDDYVYYHYPCKDTIIIYHSRHNHVIGRNGLDTGTEVVTESQRVVDKICGKSFDNETRSITIT